MNKRAFSKQVVIHGREITLYSRDKKYWESDPDSLDKSLDRVERIIRGVAPLDEGEGWRC